ncbi:hypothetical protein E4T56_gene17776 [Termitomyces sp. T112]|nr:hypothetical protein E4T56_gene17776 [Termitomyces sp. T112]
MANRRKLSNCPHSRFSPGPLEINKSGLKRAPNLLPGFLDLVKPESTTSLHKYQITYESNPENAKLGLYKLKDFKLSSVFMEVATRPSSSFGLELFFLERSTTVSNTACKRSWQEDNSSSVRSAIIFGEPLVECRVAKN